jgi:hypothetical protein
MRTNYNVGPLQAAWPSGTVAPVLQRRVGCLIYGVPLTAGNLGQTVATSALGSRVRFGPTIYVTTIVPVIPG